MILLIPLSWGGTVLSTSKPLIVVLNVICYISTHAEVFSNINDIVDQCLQFSLNASKKQKKDGTRDE